VSNDACECLGIPHPPAEAPQTFVPSPPPADAVFGFVDMHVHTSPDIFGRAIDDDEAARSAQRARMGGIVLKNHASETASRAELLVRRYGFDAWGGIVLNRSVGGLNANAVETIARIEGGRGRVVWLPTVDSNNHRKTLVGSDDGLDVVRDGKPTPELEAVVRACAASDMTLHTGHTAADDAVIVAELAQRHGVRCCITHALFPIIGFTREHVARATEVGAKIELCAIGALMGPHSTVPWMRTWGNVDAQACAAYVRDFGPQHFIISSDLGQNGNPIPTDGLRGFAADLGSAGLSPEDIRAMAVDNPRRLLGVRDLRFEGKA